MEFSTRKAKPISLAKNFSFHCASFVSIKSDIGSKDISIVDLPIFLPTRVK